MVLKHKKFGYKSPLSNPFLIGAAAVLLIAGAVFFFVNKKDSATDSANSELEIKSSGLDADQEVENVKDVEEVIAKWIEANPQAVIASIQNMQKKAMEEQMKNASKTISDKKDDLFDKKSPQYAPSGYNVTIVEFFDYSCGYCKRANSTVNSLVAEDKKVRVIYKEFPILGAASTEMSSVAIAVNMVDAKSYKKFHDALMKSNERGKAAALKVAKEVGLDSAKIEEVLEKEKDKIAAVIQANLELGSSIGINGTPGFVIGEELIPGAIELDTMKQKVAAQR